SFSVHPVVGPDGAASRVLQTRVWKLRMRQSDASGKNHQNLVVKWQDKISSVPAIEGAAADGELRRPPSPTFLGWGANSASAAMNRGSTAPFFNCRRIASVIESVR